MTVSRSKESLRASICGHRPWPWPEAKPHSSAAPARPRIALALGLEGPGAAAGALRAAPGRQEACPAAPHKVQPGAWLPQKRLVPACTAPEEWGAREWGPPRSGAASEEVGPPGAGPPRSGAGRRGSGPPRSREGGSGPPRGGAEREWAPQGRGAREWAPQGRGRRAWARGLLPRPPGHAVTATSPRGAEDPDAVWPLRRPARSPSAESGVRPAPCPGPLPSAEGRACGAVSGRQRKGAPTAENPPCGGRGAEPRRAAPPPERGGAGKTTIPGMPRHGGPPALAVRPAPTNKMRRCWPGARGGGPGSRRDPGVPKRVPGVLRQKQLVGAASRRPQSQRQGLRREGGHGEHREHSPQGVLRDGRGGAGAGASGDPDPKPPRDENQSSRQPSEAEEDLYRRYEQEQTMIQEELLQLAKREREVAREHLKSSLPWEKNGVNQEKQRSAQLAKELEGVEAELRRRDIFYKEQLGRIERKDQPTCSAPCIKQLYKLNH
ncbi:uncharacterized protein LOC141496546 [Macrotis lagotis]|uniref:uncharacterized protein LOC141496546 n=1 Tax=Macrotis lagotis TaxID=92651 RepID=UPI003D680725